MKNKNAVHPVILMRRSAFSFSDTPIDENTIHLLFEAARKARSSFNAQPWRFIYGTKDKHPGCYSNLLDMLSEKNKAWAKTAPLLILTMTETIFQHNGKENSYAFHDLGLATSNLLMQASFLGMATHPMGGFDKTKAKELFNISQNIEPSVMIALGFPGNNEHLSKEIQNRLHSAGKRMEVSEFVFKCPEAGE